MRKLQLRVHRSLQKGFTFIELLVGLTIVSLVIGIGLSLLTSVIRSTTKATISNQVKQNGDVAMEMMVRTIRGAVDVCTPSSTQINIYTTQVANCATSTLPAQVIFRCVISSTGNGSIQKSDNGGGSFYTITNDTPDPKKGVKVKSCNFQQFNSRPRRVVLDFTLKQGATLPTTSEFTAEIPFHSEVTLRNY